MSNRLLSCSSITGTNVTNSQGEDLGSIQDIMINTQSGEISYVVLSFGGFLGLGDKYFAMPWQAFSVDRSNEQFVLNVDKEKLKDAPGFDKDNWPSSANSEYLTRVNNYYGYSRESAYTH